MHAAGAINIWLVSPTLRSLQMNKYCIITEVERRPLLVAFTSKLILRLHDPGGVYPYLP